MSDPHPTYDDILGLEVPSSTIRRYLDAKYELSLVAVHEMVDRMMALQDVCDLLADTRADGKESIRLGPHPPLFKPWAETVAEMAREPTLEECGLLLVTCMSPDWCHPMGGAKSAWAKAYEAATPTQPPPNRSCQRYVNDMPIQMILNCPACGARHVDQGEFAKKEHRDHACQACGVVWRPSLCFTVGVQFLPGYKD